MINVLKILCPNLDRVVRSLIVMVQIGCDQLMGIFLIHGGEINGNEHHQPSGLGSTCCGQHAVFNFLHQVGFQFFKIAQIYCVYSLMGKLDHAPRLQYCFS